MNRRCYRCVKSSQMRTSCIIVEPETHLSRCRVPSHQNYLSSRGKSWRDLRQEALQSLEQGKYYLTGELRLPHSGLRLLVAVTLTAQSVRSSQTLRSVPAPCCATAAACGPSRSWPTSTDRASPRPSCRVRLTLCFPVCHRHSLYLLFPF